MDKILAGFFANFEQVPLHWVTGNCKTWIIKYN